MRGKAHQSSAKQKAKTLRSEGKSYAEIIETLNIPKSTLATWLSGKYPNVFNKTAQLAHLAKARGLAITARREKQKHETDLLQNKVIQEISLLDLDNKGFKKSLLAMLYWAEGAKYQGVSGLKFANTDPALSKLFISLLRSCFSLTEDRFRVKLHLHYYHKIRASQKFWSDLLNVPISQFNSTLIKKRGRKKRFRKNFMGICFISYLDSSIRKELMEFSSQLAQKFQPAP